MKRFGFLLTLLLLLASGASAQFTSTTNMGMKKPNAGLTTGWDVYLNGNFDTLDAYLGGVATLAANSATPSVTGVMDVKTNNSSPTTYTNFTGGFAGQNLTLICNDAFTTIASNATISLVSPFYCPSGGVIALSLNGTVWTETARTKGALSPDVKMIPAANCNKATATAGPGWSLGSTGSAACSAGTNNLGGYVAITTTTTTFATFLVPIPEDWDSTTPTNPYIRFYISSSDAVNAHTIIPEINIACYKGDGSTTDDVAPNGLHVLSTITLNGNANRFWSTSNVQMNGTDMTGCSPGSLMQVTVGRATDTATDAKFWSATITFPRIYVLGQAN